MEPIISDPSGAPHHVVVVGLRPHERPACREQRVVHGPVAAVPAKNASLELARLLPPRIRVTRSELLADSSSLS